MTYYALFETEIGWAGIAWGHAGLIGVHLPEPDLASARRSFIRRFPDMAEAPVPTNQTSTVTRL
jgi:methylated-DNA-[protein]-cysteine S-methyltransferase